MYLTHLTIQQIISQSFTYTITYTHYIAALYFFSLFIIVIIVSGVISVGVELPWLNLEKLMVHWVTTGRHAIKTTKTDDEPSSTLLKENS